MRTILAIAIVMLTGLDASAGLRHGDKELVHNCACTVGGGPGAGESRDWYVQLGVFTDRDRADAFVESLTARGLAADDFGAGWLTTGNALADGPWVVVSRPLRSRAAAKWAAKRYRRVVPDATVGRFVTCPDEIDEP